MSDNPINPTNPIDDETLWGEPGVSTATKEDDHYCLIKGVPCSCWDQGCQIDTCVMEND